MEDIFEIKFPIEQEMKEKVILKFSNKQGGSFNIFSYYWQCFVWAATIGFLRNERKPLNPGTERIFSLNSMRGNGGDKDAQALICMCIARTGTVDIMKDPHKAIQIISEFANGGFYHILKLMENGENTFNDMEQVKQEIFSRNYWEDSKNLLKGSQRVPAQGVTHDRSSSAEDDFSVSDDATDEQTTEHTEEQAAVPEIVRSRWTTRESTELENYYKMGMTIEQLANFYSRTEDDIAKQLQKLNLA